MIFEDVDGLGWAATPEQANTIIMTVWRNDQAHKYQFIYDTGMTVNISEETATRLIQELTETTGKCPNCKRDLVPCECGRGGLMCSFCYSESHFNIDEEP